MCIKKIPLYRLALGHTLRAPNDREAFEQKLALILARPGRAKIFLVICQDPVTN